MKLYRLYTESIERYPDYIRENLIREAPHARLDNQNLPGELQILSGGYADFGFEDFGLDKASYNKLTMAFANEGVRIPGTPYRLRMSTAPDRKVVEMADGSETATLPDNWLAAVSVFNFDVDKYTWVGKLVQPRYLKDEALVDYVDRGAGWALKT